MYLFELGSDLNDFITTRVIDQIFDYVEKRVVNSEEWEANQANKVYSDDDDQGYTETLDEESENFFAFDTFGDITDIQDKVKFKEEDVNSAWLAD